MVDDEPAIGAMVRRVAEELDYEMRFVTRGDAFKTKHRSSPDVVILDLAMPTQMASVARLPGAGAAARRC